MTPTVVELAVGISAEMQRRLPRRCETQRLGRLALVMSIALYFAVSTGLWGAAPHPSVDEKKPRRQPANLTRRRLSWLPYGMQHIIRLLQF